MLLSGTMDVPRLRSRRVCPDAAHNRARRCQTWFVVAAWGSATAWAMPEPLFSQVAPAATVVPTAASPAAAKNQPGSDAIEFSSAFTGTGKSSVDISRFETGATVLPGSYNVDIFVNEARVERRNMEFHAIAGATNAEP